MEQEEEVVESLLDQLIKPRKEEVPQRRVTFAEDVEIKYIPGGPVQKIQRLPQEVEWKALEEYTPRYVAELCLKTIMRAHDIWTLDELMSKQAELPEEDKQLLQSCINFLDGLPSVSVEAIADKDARRKASLDLLARTIPKNLQVRLEQLREENVRQRFGTRSATLEQLTRLAASQLPTEQLRSLANVCIENYLRPYDIWNWKTFNKTIHRKTTNPQTKEIVRNCLKLVHGELGEEAGFWLVGAPAGKTFTFGKPTT